MGCSIAAVHFEGQEKAYIVVGTAYIKEDEDEPSTGRLLAFGIEGEGAQRKVTLIAETEMSGAVYCLGSLRGKLVAGCNSSVEVFEWQDKEHGMSELVAKTAHSGNILVPYMKTSDISACVQQAGLFIALHHPCVASAITSNDNDTILVGDLMRSVSILRYKEEDET
eukprot:17820-Heterococcus_DN1.PRE.1